MRFAKAIAVLCEAEVQFVVIGGLSATLHGSSQVTYRLDICYSGNARNVLRLAGSLAPFHPKPRGFPAGLPFICDETTLQNTTLLTLITDIGEIDLLAEVTGLGDFTHVRSQSIKVEAFGYAILTLNLAGLIQAKRAAGRPKDLSILPELESLLETRGR